MSDRKDEILKIIVEEYIQAATPVSSSLIVEKYLKDLSSATVRNDMADLEEMGLIFQPYTSAGRMPTIDGYKKYLDNINIADWQEVSSNGQKTVDSVEIGVGEQQIKELAKALAEASDSAVLIGFSPLNVYYTGISNIFRQPEFKEQSVIFSISEIIDHLDEVMHRIFHQVDGGTGILMGAGNPFGELTSVIVAKCQVDNGEILMGIMGPNRMNYKENIGLLKYVQKKLKSNTK